MKKVLEAKNPKWANKEKTLISLEVNFEHLEEEFVPFGASPNDSEEHGRIIFEKAAAGEYGEVAEWVPPSNVVGDAAMARLRSARNALLSVSDYIEMPTKWATLTEEEKHHWAEYRNALRDLPAAYPTAELHWNESYTNLAWVNVIWPTAPN